VSAKRKNGHAADEEYVAVSMYPGGKRR